MTVRDALNEQIDELAARDVDGSLSGEIAELRDRVAAFRLPADRVTVRVTHQDAVVGAAQIKTLVHLFGAGMPQETKELLTRIVAALKGAE